MRPVTVSAYTLTCGLGAGMKEVRANIAASSGGLSNHPWPDSDINTWLGRIESIESIAMDLPAKYDSRNNRIARLALSQDGFTERVAVAIDRYGAHRCALLMGTSTASIDRTESSYRRVQDNGEFAAADNFASLHSPNSTTEFVAEVLGIQGPALTISTACSSSAKVFASAARWLQSDLVDAVIVGGVDSLGLSVIYGFHALQLVSAEPCAPFDVGRAGLSLGEAGGFALLTSSSDASSPGSVALLGYGESLDAYHMSSAPPDGIGAELAMRAASESAGIPLDKIDYLNFHGTGTRANDAVEGKVCSKLFADDLICSSTKGWTGHTLGAAGITEAIISFDAFSSGLLPGTLNTRTPDPELRLNLLLENYDYNPQFVMSNSFGFGGNNCSLIFGRAN
jgi:3-oxoacyl-[acyl-carrier-protein] synthase-1